MIFCRGCGKEIHESALSCPGCGAQQIVQRQVSVASNDETNFIMHYVNAWKTAFVFNGRVRRRAYWLFVLVHAIVMILCAILDQAFRSGETIATLYNIAAFLPGLSLGVKRMHDVGKNGWWVIVPFINIYYAVKDSDQSVNEYGPSPKYAMA